MKEKKKENPKEAGERFKHSRTIPHSMPFVEGPPITMPKRPVLTITLSAKGMAALESATSVFERIAKEVPEWVPVPTTKAAVAAWIVNNYVMEAEWIMRALLWENNKELPEATNPGPAPELGDPGQYEWLLSQVEEREDAYIQSLRNLIKVPKE